jgi:hypothetical protein
MMLSQSMVRASGQRMQRSESLDPVTYQKAEVGFMPQTECLSLWWVVERPECSAWLNQGCICHDGVQRHYNIMLGTSARPRTILTSLMVSGSLRL